MIRRQTLQKEMVLEAVRSLKNHATADDVYEYINKSHPVVGKGTIYRNLNLLAEEGTIRKIQVPGGPERFDHNTAEHYHVKCITCGKVFDVDMDILPDLSHHIRAPHDMKFLSYEILFRGICSACQTPVPQ